MTKVLLKCRPTPAQLSDRLADPAPEGLELYLDAADISGDNWLDVLKSRIAGSGVDSDFAWIVEGPLRSLDGEFFDISVRSQANLEVVRRLTIVGEAICASGVVIHAIAPVRAIADLKVDSRLRAIDEGCRFLAEYARLCRDAGLVPSVENIPPVARMRENSYTYSLLGVDPNDLQMFADRIPGLRGTFDISHAGLFVDCFALGAEDVEPELRPLLSWVWSQSEARSIDDCVTSLGGNIWNVHVSNARGLLDEGLPYGEGNYDIDSLIPLLAERASFIVTETIEPNADKAAFMREAQARIESAMGRERHIAGGHN